MGVLEDIREQYPTLAWLLNDPQVGPLLKRAVDPASPYSVGRFQAELMQTAWFKNRSQTAREADILFHTDRKTYDANARNMRGAIRQRAIQLGVGITEAEVNWLANTAIRNGTDPSSPIIDSGLLQIRNKPGRQREGAVRTYARAAQQMAQGQYYLDMHQASAKKWGQYIATGGRTVEDLQNYLNMQAISKYPWLKRQLEKGVTVDELFSEHKAAISNILEFDPDQLRLTDGKWRKVIDYMDHNTKKRRMMTVGEAEYLARQDPRFWKTKQGRTADSQYTSMMLNIFGKRTL